MEEPVTIGEEVPADFTEEQLAERYAGYYLEWAGNPDPYLVTETPGVFKIIGMGRGLVETRSIGWWKCGRCVVHSVETVCGGDLVALAEKLAREAHAGQLRRDGVTPYIKHQEEVAGYFTDPESQAIAWLHDTIEDTELTPHRLERAGMPEHIIAAVRVLTHSPNEPYKDYMERVMVHPLARRVKFADIICNLTSDPSDRQQVKYAMALARYLPLIS